jgi:molybdopterin converting factor small subunit
MSALIRLPDSLAAHADGRKEVSVSGACLRDAIDALTTLHPATRSYICDERGDLLRFVAVLVDGVDARTLQAMETPISPGAEIDIVKAIAGG